MASRYPCHGLPADWLVAWSRSRFWLQAEDGIRDQRHTGGVQLAGQPGQSLSENPARERPIVLARLGDDRAVDAVAAAQSAQPVGGGGLVVRVADIVLTAQPDRAGVGHRETVIPLRYVIRRNGEPARDVVVSTVSGDYGGRVERGPGVGVAAEQPSDGLRLGSGVRADVAGDVDK